VERDVTDSFPHPSSQLSSGNPMHAPFCAQMAGSEMAGSETSKVAFLLFFSFFFSCKSDLSC